MTAKNGWLDAEAKVSNVRSISAFGQVGSVAVTFGYKAAEHYYSGEFTANIRNGFREGDTIPLQYNPSNPEENDLNDKGTWLRLYRLAYFPVIAAIVLYISLRGCH